MIRFLKQFLYGIFYLAVFAFFFFIVWAAFFKSVPQPVEAPAEKPLPEIPNPIFVFEDVTTEIEGDEVKVTGILRNETPQVSPSVRIRASLFNASGVEIFSSETVKEDIRAFESRSFTVFFPKDGKLADSVDEDLTEVSYDFR